MRMKNRRASYRMGIGLSCLALCLSFSGLAQAIPVTFSFQGSIQGASSQLNPPIVPNTVISGAYTFESTAPDLLPGNLAVGTYALSAFSVSLLGNAYSMGPVGERIITITNSSTTDTYRVGLARVELDQPQAIVGPSINGWAPRAFSLSITENGLFNNDSLPLAPPSLGPSPLFTMTFFRVQLRFKQPGD